MGSHRRKFSYGDTLPNYIIQYTLGNIHCKEKNLKNVAKGTECDASAGTEV